MRRTQIERPDKNRLIPLLTGPRLPWLLVLIGVLLALPTLWSGFFTDDYMHQGILKGVSSHAVTGKPILDMYSLLDADPENAQALVKQGLLPWWVSKQAKIRFFRPLSAATHWLDYTLWPDRPGIMHAHTLIYWALLILLLVFFYRRFLPTPWIAGLAALFYVLDDAHAVDILWLANRCSLLATAFGILTLILHDKARKSSRPIVSGAAVLAFAVGLACQEMAVTTLAYLTAYELFLSGDSYRKRALALLPYVAVACLWYAGYAAAGFGSANTALYTGPLADPLRFIGHCIERAPVLLLSQFALPSAMVYPTLNPAFRAVHWIGAAAVLALLFLLVKKKIGRDPAVRFWIAGILLSCPIACAAFLSDRHLLFIGLGGMGLMASLVASLPRKSFVRNAVLVLYLLLAPLLFQAKISFTALLSRGYHQPIADIAELSLRDDQTAVIVNGTMWFSLYARLNRLLREEGSVPPVYSLGPPMGAIQDLRIDRPAGNALTLRPENGFEHMMVRDPADRFAAGERIILDKMTMEILEVNQQGVPMKVRYTFPVPLEDESLRWYAIRNDRAVPFSLPAVGETALIPGISVFREWFGNTNRS